MGSAYEVRVLLYLPEYLRHFNVRKTRDVISASRQTDIDVEDDTVAIDVNKF